MTAPSHDLSLLRDLVVLVAVAIPVAVLAHKIRIPTVVGFLLTGVAIGPYALGLIPARESVAGLAEIGVVLLLFAIGLELSLKQIIRARRMMLLGGSLQVLGTLLVVAVIVLVAGTPWQHAVFLGSLAALSSTAIVLKIYRDRGELDTPHGRLMVSILTFQDLCVVPLILLAPLLAESDLDAAGTGRTLGLSFLVVGLLVVGGRVAIPWILDRVALAASRETFTLAIVFLGLGSAYATASFGLSLALGAFIAGLIISESEYGLQGLSDVLPFRDTFSGIFFISIGMLLNLEFLAAEAGRVAMIAVGAIVVKFLVAASVFRFLGQSTGVSLVAGLGLAQVGEFSFVLAEVGQPLGLLTPGAFQTFLAASILSMLATPAMIHLAAPLVRRFGVRWGIRMGLQKVPGAPGIEDHVIIVGFGVNGRNLGRVLTAAGIPYVILDQDARVVREGRAAGEPIYFGDGTRPEILHRVSIERARVLVLAISSPADEGRGVVVARRMNPGVRIIVRTRYLSAMEDLTQHGASEVIPEEFETSIEIFSRVLRNYGVAGNVIQREVQALRSEHYEMFRGLRMPDLRLDSLAHLGVHRALDTIQVEEGARAVGENPVTLSLQRKTGAIVIAVVRDGVAFYTPDPEFRFRPLDTVVLVGDRESLERGTLLFRRAGAS